MINRTQRTFFEKELQSAWRNNRRSYPKRVAEVTDTAILKDIQSGAAKVRKKLPNKEEYHRHGIEKFFVVPSLEAKRKREAQERAKCDKRNAGYNAAYYKACDAIARTEPHQQAAKIVEDFKKLSKGD